MSPAPWERPPSGPASAIVARLAAQIPTLETPRLRLRAPRIEDFETYAGIALSPRGGDDSREAAWLDFNQMVAGWLLRGFGLWSVERRADRRHIGFIPLGHEFGDPEAEIGWFVAADAEGRGFAREAAEAARAFAFERLGWASVVSYVDPDNARSIALAERLGAVRAPETVDGALVYRHAATAEARP